MPYSDSRRVMLFWVRLASAALTIPTLCHAIEAGVEADSQARAGSGGLVFFNESAITPGAISAANSAGLVIPAERNKVVLVEINEDKSSANRGAKYRVVHQWANELKVEEGSPAYLTRSGLALISGYSYPGFPSVQGVKPSIAAPIRYGTGAHGVLRLLEPDGSVVWQYTKCDYDTVVNDAGVTTGLSAGSECLHHDVDAMDNGHILTVAFKKRSREEILAKGYDRQKIMGSAYDPNTSKTPEFLWVEKLYELKPIFGPDAKRQCEQRGLAWSVQAPYCTQIVWELDLFDYLSADRFNAQKLDINYPGWDAHAKTQGFSNNQLHINSIAYSEVRNEIVVSSYTYNELLVFTKDDKKELVYRWGQPRNYACEIEEPALCGQVFQSQHDVTWVETDSPSQQRLKPRLLIHNNRNSAPANPTQPVRDDPECSGVECSQIIEISAPVDAQGRFTREPGKPFGPFPYAGERENFKLLYGPFATTFSGGVRRYPNGDLLITKSNNREFRRVRVTNPPGGDKGVRDSQGSWVWNTGSIPYFDQLLDARTNTYQPASCVDLAGTTASSLNISCPQIFKASLVPVNSPNFINLMRRKHKPR